MQTPTPNVNDVIDHLAAKLSVPAAHLWQVLVAQVRVSAIQDFIVLVVFGIPLVMFLAKRKALHVWAKSGDDYDEGDRWWGAFGCYVLGTICAVIVLISVCSMVGELANPEYYALKEILATLSK